MRTYSVQFLRAGKVIRSTFVTATSDVSATVAAIRKVAILSSEWDEAEATAL